MKKVLKMLLVVFAVCMLIKVTPEKAQAASITKLTAGKTYTTADFTGDNVKDSFKYVLITSNGTKYARVYINGKYNCTINLIRGGDLYRIAYNRNNIYLMSTMGQSSGNACAAFRYSNGRFRIVYNANAFNVCSIAYQVPYLAVSNALYMKIDTGKSYGGTFDCRYSRGATFRTKYTVGAGKIKLATRVASAIGRTTYTSRKTFTTSTSMSYMNGLGPKVYAGQTVILDRAYFHKTTGLWYRIKVNGKYGWIKDSSNYLLY